MARTTRGKRSKRVETITHHDASRKNIPTAEHEPVMSKKDRAPVEVAYERRNRELDPQLVWRGKDAQDSVNLTVQAPPLFIQEKVHPKALINDLLRLAQTAEEERIARETGAQTDLFADFNGLPTEDARTEFYQHDANWSNRIILGDSLQVMASLAEREGLAGKVQCIYVDPPYGIKFNSNFQWSTTSRDVRDGNAAHITREPEQVKAFRDTWRDGIHSYLTYLRDRLTVARDLLTDSGSVFVQIGDENMHRVRVVMDEVFGEHNFVSQISFAKTTGFSASTLSNVADYLLWYARDINLIKFRQLSRRKQPGEPGATAYRPVSELHSVVGFEPTRLGTSDQLTSQGASAHSPQRFVHRGRPFEPPTGLHWKTTVPGMERLDKAGRVFLVGNTLRYLRFLDDFPVVPFTNNWTDTGIAGFTADKLYVVQTLPKVIERCILMTTDPGDLVLDPTCGSGTTAYVAEQWGRRWITVDTSRVALALARARIMGARYPYYTLHDSPEGQAIEAQITRMEPEATPTYRSVRLGFVYERVPHITLKSIAQNAEIDVIWDRWQDVLKPLGAELNQALDVEWDEWQIPQAPATGWSEQATGLHAKWQDARRLRQDDIDAAISASADFELLYDKPYEDRGKVRVAGPFTVESISPHRALDMDENDELVDRIADARLGYGETQDFASVILEHLRSSGLQQSHKQDRIAFSSITPWPGDLICAEARYVEGESDVTVEQRAAIFVGPEFGTVARPDLVAAAREAADADFDVLIACAFNYDAHASDFRRLGRVPILQARMNADLHMADDLKNTGKGNLFVVFGEPDIDIIELSGENGAPHLQVKINGVDVYHPNTGEIHSDGASGIACWFVDTDYDEESFFVRQAYFLGAKDPYRALKTTLKAEVSREAWETLRSDTSRPFAKPISGRIAVKVINHLGDEVMKVFGV